VISPQPGPYDPCTRRCFSAPPQILRMTSDRRIAGDYICASPGDDNADGKKTSLPGCKVCKKDERCAIDTYDLE
jgi:hypothetical protein